MADAVNAPTLTSGVDDIVDSLELTAMLDPFGVARLDALLGQMLMQEEIAEDNIAERDRRREQICEDIENEVALRQSELIDVYPFGLSESGDELVVREDWRNIKFAFYIICLIATHTSKSAILDMRLDTGLLTRLRNAVFQTVSTLGLAGLSSGPAFSVGWPRRTGETIVEILNRAAAAGGGFVSRNPPGPYTSPRAKDGGIDVIAWTSGGVPPPVAFYFGQAASGKNWPGKPVADHARVFRSAYIQDHMTGNILYYTIIPHRVLDDKFWNSQHLLHYGILDRLRLPRYAWQGAELAAGGVPIDGFDRLGDLAEWIEHFVREAQAV